MQLKEWMFIFEEDGRISVPATFSLLAGQNTWQSQVKRRKAYFGSLFVEVSFQSELAPRQRRTRPWSDRQEAAKQQAVLSLFILFRLGSIGLIVDWCHSHSDWAFPLSTPRIMLKQTVFTPIKHCPTPMHRSIPEVSLMSTWGFGGHWGISCKSTQGGEMRFEPGRSSMGGGSASAWDTGTLHEFKSVRLNLTLFSLWALTWDVLLRCGQDHRI